MDASRWSIRRIEMNRGRLQQDRRIRVELRDENWAVSALRRGPTLIPDDRDPSALPRCRFSEQIISVSRSLAVAGAAETELDRFIIHD